MGTNEAIQGGISQQTIDDVVESLDSSNHYTSTPLRRCYPCKPTPVSKANRVLEEGKVWLIKS